MMIDLEMRATNPRAEAPEAKMAHWKLNMNSPELDWLMVFSSVFSLWIFASHFHLSNFSLSVLPLQESPMPDMEHSMKRAHVAGQCQVASQILIIIMMQIFIFQLVVVNTSKMAEPELEIKDYLDRLILPLHLHFA